MSSPAETVEAAVRADLEELGDLEAGQRSLAASALTLARALDEGAGMAAAAVARELRETMRALTDEGDGDDATAALLERLSAPARHPEKP